MTNYHLTPSAPLPSRAVQEAKEKRRKVLDAAAHTRKANEIYNRADASYGAVFVEKINEVVNSSSYPNELTKINAAKGVVDQVHNFLARHLK